MIPLFGHRFLCTLFFSLRELALHLCVDIYALISIFQVNLLGIFHSINGLAEGFILLLLFVHHELPLLLIELLIVLILFFHLGIGRLLGWLLSYRRLNYCRLVSFIDLYPLVKF